jgi:hypothetical protein
MHAKNVQLLALSPLFTLLVLSKNSPSHFLLENLSGNCSFLFESAPEMILQEVILKLEFDVLFTMPYFSAITKFQIRKFYLAVHFFL